MYQRDAQANPSLNSYMEHSDGVPVSSSSQDKSISARSPLATSSFSAAVATGTGKVCVVAGIYLM